MQRRTPDPDDRFSRHTASLFELAQVPDSADAPPQQETAPENRLQDLHRIAGCANATGGIHGNPLLDNAAELLQPRVDPRTVRIPDELRAWAASVREARLAALELEEAGIEYDEAASKAAVARRRIEKRAAIARRQADVEAQRAAGGMYVGEARSPNRPAHVQVDASAWAVVKSNAVRRRIAVAEAVAQLVIEAIEHGVRPQHRALFRPEQPSVRGRRAQRFARLFVDDETWCAFRSLAIDSGVTTARLLGVVVEVEAHRLGWRKESER